MGCVVYEMCALTPPFVANGMDALYRKILRGVFDRIPSRYSKDMHEFVN